MVRMIFVIGPGNQDMGQLRMRSNSNKSDNDSHFKHIYKAAYITVFRLVPLYRILICFKIFPSPYYRLLASPQFPHCSAIA